MPDSFSVIRNTVTVGVGVAEKEKKILPQKEEHMMKNSATCMNAEYNKEA